MHYGRVDQASIALLERARDRLIAAGAELRADGEADAADAVDEGIAQVLPNLPGLIDGRLTTASAQIYTREQMQALLAQFAIDVLQVQGDCILEAIERRRSR